MANPQDTQAAVEQALDKLDDKKQAEARNVAMENLLKGINENTNLIKSTVKALQERTDAMDKLKKQEEAELKELELQQEEEQKLALPPGIKGKAIGFMLKIPFIARIAILIVGIIALYFVYSNNGLFSIATIFVLILVLLWGWLMYQAYKLS